MYAHAHNLPANIWRESATYNPEVSTVDHNCNLRVAPILLASSIVD